MGTGADILALRFFKAVICTKDMFVFNKIEFRHVLPGVAKDIYVFLLEYSNKYGQLPIEKAVEDEFGKVLPVDIEDAIFLLDKLLDRHLTAVLSNSLQKVADLLDKNNPKAAFIELEKVREATPRVVKVSSHIVEAIDRVDTYKAALVSGVFDGIKTPWDDLNKAIQGWMNGTLTVILGRQNTGKSWLTCAVGVDCLLQDKKSLLVTMEMPIVKIHRRLDAIRHKLNFGRLRNATLSIDEVKRWEDAVILPYAGSGDILVVDKQTIRTVLDVYLLVKQYKPDIVLIDGGYRFESDGGGTNWESTVRIVSDLQRYAEESKIPWVVTNQYGDANDKVEKRKSDTSDKMDARGTRYGKEWAIHPDVVIGLQQLPEERILRKMQIHILKVRDADAEANVEMFHINWDLTASSFSSIVPLLGVTV